MFLENPNPIDMQGKIFFRNIAILSIEKMDKRKNVERRNVFMEKDFSFHRTLEIARYILERIAYIIT